MVLKEKKKPKEKRSRMDKEIDENTGVCKERRNIINRKRDEFGGLFFFFWFIF